MLASPNKKGKLYRNWVTRGFAVSLQEDQEGSELPAMYDVFQMLQLVPWEQPESEVWLRARRSFEEADLQMLAPDELLLAPLSASAALRYFFEMSPLYSQATGLPYLSKPYDGKFAVFVKIQV